MTVLRKTPGIDAPSFTTYLPSRRAIVDNYLGWIPKVTFKVLARMMTDHDHQLAKEERVLRDHRKNNA